jgi:Flp pilus assembly protein TadG
MRSVRFASPRSLWRDRKGAAAAEFGLVAPLLVAMTLGMTEYSMVFFSYGAMQSAARDVARQVAVNTLPAGSAQTEVRERVPSWVRDSVTVSVTQTTPANPATNVYTMRVQAPIAAATPISFYTKAQSSQLSTTVEMKQELPFVEVG